MVSNEDREGEREGGRESEWVRKWKLYTTSESLSRESTRHDICTFYGIAVPRITTLRLFLFPFSWCVSAIKTLRCSLAVRTWPRSRCIIWIFLVMQVWFDDAFLNRLTSAVSSLALVPLHVIKLSALLHTVLNLFMKIFIWKSEWWFATLLHICQQNFCDDGCYFLQRVLWIPY